LNRVEDITLLREITVTCDSFHYAQSVSIAKNPETEGYLLKAKWTPHSSEQPLLRIIAQKYGTEISIVNGFTVFHKSKISS
jgi:hypothetical protein